MRASADEESADQAQLYIRLYSMNGPLPEGCNFAKRRGARMTIRVRACTHSQLQTCNCHVWGAAGGGATRAWERRCI